MLYITVVAVCLSVVTSETLDCTGDRRYHATGTGYYPADDPIEGGFVDMQDHGLQTLQDFLDGSVQWVSVAMDKFLHIPYGTELCIPELNHKYNRVIKFKVVDTGSAFYHKGYTRIDICTRNKQASYDNTINGPLTLVFKSSTSTVQASNLDCIGSHRYSSRGTGYYPADDPIEGGFFDRQGHPLHTLQDFLDGSAAWVSVAMDKYLHLPYGTHLCIPELNHKYNKIIPFRVVDTGSAFYHKGYSRIDICTRNQHFSYDNTINGPLTLVFA